MTDDILEQSLKDIYERIAELNKEIAKTPASQRKPAPGMSTLEELRETQLSLLPGLKRAIKEDKKIQALGPIPPLVRNRVEMEPVNRNPVMQTVVMEAPPERIFAEYPKDEAWYAGYSGSGKIGKALITTIGWPNTIFKCRKCLGIKPSAKPFARAAYEVFSCVCK
jgi:hypothetical protein